jgi:hypothetical protein
MKASIIRLRFRQSDNQWQQRIFVQKKLFFSFISFCLKKLLNWAKMEIEKVNSEIEKVITKFTAINKHSSELIANEISSLENLRATLMERKL